MVTIAANTSLMSKDGRRRGEMTASDLEAAGRLRQIWEAKRVDLSLTQESAGERLGMNQSAVSQYLNGKIPIGTDALLRWASLLQVAPSEIRPERAGLMTPIPADTLTHRQNMIPVVGIVQGGSDGFWEEMGYPPGHGDGCVDWPSADPNAYAVECRGDSMQPRVRHGEILVVEPGTPYSPGDEVVVLGADGRKMIKVFVFKRAGRIYLDSVNADHPQFSIDEAQVEAIHYVAGIVKPSRRRDASDDQCRVAIEQHRQQQERHARRRQVDGFLASLPNKES